MFKSEIAPKGIEFRSADFSISDKVATILTVISYPRYIDHGYLANLTNMSGIKLVIKHMPLPFSILSKMLNKEIADLRARYQQEKDVTIQERIRQDIDSLEYYIQQFTASQTKTFDFPVVIFSFDLQILPYSLHTGFIFFSSVKKKKKKDVFTQLGQG